MIKPKLNLAILAMSCVASFSAYADGPVTLKNSIGTVSWADFVGVINGTKTVKGTVPENDETIAAAKAAVAAANTVLGEKEDALTAAQNFLNATGADGVQGKLAAAKATLTEKQKAVETAQGAVATAQTALSDYISTAFEKAYNDAVAERDTKKNETLPGLQSQRTQLLSDSTSLVGQISTARSSLRTLNGQLAALPKKTGTVAWLKNMYSAADLFYTDLDGANMESTAKIYCGIQNYSSGGFTGQTTKKRLLLAFGTQPTTPEDVTWKSYSPFEFYHYISGDSDNGIPALETPGEAAVYLGPEYTAISGVASGFIKITYSDNYLTLANNALMAISPLMNNSDYKGATDEYQDQTAANDLKKHIAEVEAEIAGYEKQLNGVHKDKDGNLPEGETTEVNGVLDNLRSVNQQIAQLQSDINTLTNTTIPNLKANWDAAVAGTLEKGKDEKYDELKKAVSDAEAAVTTAEGAVTAAQTAVDDAQAAVDAAQKAVDDAQAEVDTANDDVTAANKALADAEAAAQSEADAKLLAAYQEVTLTDNIDADTPVTETFTGTIRGNGNVINVSTSTPLFSTFSGHLMNAAVNGTFAGSSRNAYYENVAVSTGSAFRYYNDNNVQSTATTIAELGFNVRDFFGVNFADKKLTNLTDASKVYSITVYQPNSSKQSYVQIKDNGFVSASGPVTVPVNMFAKSETNDVTGFKNIFYVEDGANVCDNVEIADATNFFCPVNLTAKSVTYSRDFVEGMNTACLPFEISKASNAAISSVCTYDREDLSNNKFWFTKIDGTIPANTPLIVMATKAFKLNLTNVDFVATDASQKVLYKATSEGAGESFGIFKTTASGEFLGESNSNRIYGLSLSDMKFHPSSGSSFPAFRMVVAIKPSSTESQAQPTQQLAPFHIAIQDEFGNVICDKYDNDYLNEVISGVENVKSDASSISVAAGQGEIIITSESDYGQVAIYSLDGRMVAKVDVIAGTNNVNVQKGIYVVLGKKVMVK